MVSMGGGDDSIVSPKTIGRTAQFFGEELAPVFRDCGHLMMLDTRWRDVADRTITWIEEFVKKDD